MFCTFKIVYKWVWLSEFIILALLSLRIISARYSAFMNYTYSYDRYTMTLTSKKLKMVKTSKTLDFALSLFVIHYMINRYMCEGKQKISRNFKKGRRGGGSNLISDINNVVIKKSCVLKYTFFQGSLKKVRKFNSFL